MRRTTLNTLALLVVTLGLAPHAAAQGPQPKGPDPHGPYADLQQAAKLISESKGKEAEMLLQSVVDRIPRHPGAWYQLAIARDLQGKHELALAAAKLALEVDRTHAGALLLAGRLLVREDPEHAAELAIAATRLAGEDPVALRKAARILADARRPKLALPIVEKAAARYPADQDLLYLKAELALATGDADSAAEVYKKLIPLRPHDPWPAESLAGIALAKGDKRAAIPWLEQSLKTRPSNLAARHKLIRLLEQIGAPETELALHKKLAKLYAAARETPAQTPAPKADPRPHPREQHAEPPAPSRK